MVLKYIGLVLVGFSLICWGMKHIFYVEFMHTLIWVAIGLVGGIIIWISNIRKMGQE